MQDALGISRRHIAQTKKQLPLLTPKMKHVHPGIKLTFHKLALFALSEAEDKNQVRCS